jgi:hypothetical protein
MTTRRLITPPSRVTVLECTQCDGGTYAPLSVHADVWTCDNCGHDISAQRDIRPYLEPDEHGGTPRLTETFIAEGEVRLAWTTRRTTSCTTCGTTNGLHFSVRVGNDMPAHLIPCPAESE